MKAASDKLCPNDLSSVLFWELQTDFRQELCHLGWPTRSVIGSRNICAQVAVFGTGLKFVYRTKVQGLVDGSRFSSITTVARGRRSCNDLARVLHSDKDIFLFVVIKSGLGCGGIRTDRRQVSNSGKLDGIRICTSYYQQYILTLFGCEASKSKVCLFFTLSKIFQGPQGIFSGIPLL